MTPAVSPVICLPTWTRPKAGIVGLVTVRVAVPLAGTVALLVALVPSDQVALPQT